MQSGAYGVIDHNHLDMVGNVYTMQVNNGSNGCDKGNGVWADYPWFGTDKFLSLMRPILALLMAYWLPTAR